MRLLIVEDEFAIADFINDVASERGHTVIGRVRRGGSALSIAQSEMPDLALVDMKLSGPQSGESLATLLGQLYGIRSIFISGHPDRCRNAAKATNAIGCLIKPFNEEELAAALAIAGAILKGMVPTPPPRNLEVYSYVF